jgi:hypothetical protein
MHSPKTNSPAYVLSVDLAGTLQADLVFRLDEDNTLLQAAKQVQAFDDANPEDNAFFAAAMMDGLDSNETFDVAKLNALCRN